METKVVACAVIEKDDLLLLGRKANGVGPYPDCWHLLGGKIKSGEGIFDALKREVREESGIELKEIEPLFFDEDIQPDKHGVKTHFIFLSFKAKYASGDLTPSEEIVELKWFAKNKLSDLTPPSNKLFKKLGLLK